MSKLAEVFDLTSKIKSIIATTKMDLNNLVQRGRKNHKSIKNEFKIEYCKYSDSQNNQMEVSIWPRYDCSSGNAKSR